ncbi:MAG: SGNH/GDSL hydrolase family protein [Cyclobacteriaceae bacterium]
MIKHFNRLDSLAFILPILVLLVNCTEPTPGNSTQVSDPTYQTKWVGTWSCAPYAAEARNTPPAPYLENNTLRQVIRVSIGGKKLRMKFSNKTSATPTTMNAVNIAVSKGAEKIDAATLTPLSFNGDGAVTMAPYSSVLSDPFEFDLDTSMRLAITIHYGSVESNADITSHVASRTDSYILEGNQSTSADFEGATITAHWFHIQSIDVMAPDHAASIGVIGNSITDGYGLHGGLQNRWPDKLSEKLLANPKTANVGVLNLGIGATLVSGTHPTTGVSRYKDDLLSQSGIKWIIMYYGTNDINAGISADTIISAYETIIAGAHDQDIKVYGATITPFNGSGHYSAENEQVRNSVNDWIRTPGNFDAVIDFDQTIRDPEDPSRMLEKYSKDWLHPNIAGYAFLGGSVDPDLFIFN